MRKKLIKIKILVFIIYYNDNKKRIKKHEIPMLSYIISETTQQDYTKL